MDINPATELELIPASFSDIDLFSDWVTNLDWDVEATQLSAGGNEIRYDHFASQELVVGHFTMKQRLQMLSVVPDGMVVFLISRAKFPMVWNARHYPSHLMGIAFSGLEGCAIHPAAWECYEFSISEDLVRRTGLLPQDFLTKAAHGKHVFVPLVEPITGQFLERLDGIFDHGRRSQSLLHKGISRIQFQDFVILGLLEIIEAGLHAQGIYPPRSSRRADLVEKANDFMYAHLENDLSADDLAQTLGVSYRVLNYAFRDSIGVSPYQYMLTLKLHAVRRLLKTGDCSVSDASQLHGFKSPSRFSHQYSRLFGELPSATKSKNQR
jgi:AraC-like DNA-binding protein